MQQQLGSWRQRGYRHRPRHPSNINSNKPPVKTIAIIKTDEEAAVAVVAAAVDEVQAAAEPVVGGPDTSNLEQAGWATNAKEGKQTQTRT